MRHAKNLILIYVDKSRICLHKTGYVAHISSRKCLHNLIAARIGVMFFNGGGILIEQTIQHIGRFAHKAIDDINVILFPTIVCMVIQRQSVPHPEISGIVTSIEGGGCHPKANAIRRRGFPIAEKRREGKRSMIGNEMMDRRSQGFFAEIPIICCFQFM